MEFCHATHMPYIAHLVTIQASIRNQLYFRNFRFKKNPYF